MSLTPWMELLLLPPGPMLWLSLFALCLLWRGRRRSGLALGLFSCLALYLAATPMGASWVARPLESSVLPVQDLQQLRSAGYQAIVVLGGGRDPQAMEFAGRDVANATLLVRLRYAAHVQRQSGLPLLVTGGLPRGGQVAESELMADSLRQDFGVPVRWQESLSRTTRENAELSAPLLQAQGVQRIVLVSHAVHLPRARANFEAAGFVVLPAPTGYTLAPGSLTRSERWLPQHESLAATRRAGHEWLGLARDRVLALLP